MSRVRGFAEWNPRSKSLELVDNIQTILVAMHEYLPLTLRQVFYRLVVAGQIDKTEKGYARLCEVCNRARRAGRLMFSDIRDDGPSINAGFDFTDANHLTNHLRELKTGARMDLQSFQERRVWVWCEAQGMVPQLKRVALEYGVSVISSGGFDSLTMKYDMAKQLSDDCVVLHLGDHDPSGVHIFKSLAEDINALRRSPDVVKAVFGFSIEDILTSDIEFIRLAVTPEQVEEMELPTAPAKKTDNRKFAGNLTTQCEAISPPDLARILEDAILSYTDEDRYAEALAWQDEMRESA